MSAYCYFSIVFVSSHVKRHIGPHFDINVLCWQKAVAVFFLAKTNAFTSHWMMPVQFFLAFALYSSLPSTQLVFLQLSLCKICSNKPSHLSLTTRSNFAVLFASDILISDFIATEKCPVSIIDTCDVLLPTFSFVWQTEAIVLHCRA